MNVETLILVARDRLVSVKHTARLTEAAARLGQDGADLVVVCDEEGLLCGVVGKTDIVSRIARCHGSSCTEMVANVMTTEVVTCGLGDPLMEVWSRMKERSFIHVPVVDAKGRPVGLLAARDVLQALLGEVEYEETLLREFVMGVGYR
ncbi:MAG: CBS domain-containing protein [Geminicoccaceae bacterium]|nr:CBS domain-containing protein [Geminicoccaceae bacterium]